MLQFREAAAGARAGTGMEDGDPELREALARSVAEQETKSSLPPAGECTKLYKGTVESSDMHKIGCNLSIFVVKSMYVPKYRAFETNLSVVSVSTFLAGSCLVCVSVFALFRKMSRGTFRLEGRCLQAFAFKIIPRLQRKAILNPG